MKTGAAIPTRRGDVVDEYHGTRVADPYRWLEDAGSAETMAWVAAQNDVTASYLGAVPARAGLKARLTELWDYPRHGVPEQHGARTFFSRNDGLQDQAVLYVREGDEGEPRVLLDPNTLSPDGTVALTNQAISKDGALLAFGTSSGGSDWQELRIREVTSGRDYDETIRRCRFTSVAWAPDNSGFFYSRFPQPGSMAPEDESNYNQVYWHHLGQPQENDTLVYERRDAKELGFAPSITDDGRYLLLSVYRGTSPRTGIYYRLLDDDGPFTQLLDEGEAAFEPIETIGTQLYIRTDLDAPRGRIVAIDLRNAARQNWREVVPQGENIVDFVTMVADRLVVVYLHDAHHQIVIYDPQGQRQGEIALPALGALGGISGKRSDRALYLSFMSFLQPGTVFRYDMDSGSLDVVYEPRLTFDPTLYETKQVFFASRDGTRVPMFLTHRKGLALNGQNPTLLYGYGGFTISVTPAFSPSRIIWLENGGILASVNLRGGAEYGEEWHQAGMLERKQNVFDDFIAAGEWLIEHGFTNTARLASNGASNGGLLVAACMVQRPDLFGAVVCQVPVIDMLRYHRFTVGRYWVSEYGNAETDPHHFRYLLAYSPLHNIRPGTHYPATLITSADTDDRVVPAHAKKFAATLQAAQAGEAPILLRVETKAGHGAGKPTSKMIDEQADICAFLFAVFGLALP